MYLGFSTNSAADAVAMSSQAKELENVIASGGINEPGYQGVILLLREKGRCFVDLSERGAALCVHNADCSCRRIGLDMPMSRFDQKSSSVPLPYSA
jgi:hypothetical protein